MDRRAAESEVRAALELMPQLVWTTSPDGYHDYYNGRWYDFTGMPRPGDPNARAEGWNWSTYLHPDDLERTRELWTACLASGAPYEIEYRFREAATGNYRWFLARALPMRDSSGSIVRWFGTCTDIHDHKLTSERLSESEKRFRSSMRYSGIGNAIVGLDGRFVQVNPALARILGRTEEALTGVTFQSITHPEDLDADLTLLRRLLAGEIESYEMDKRYLHLDGSAVWVQLNVSLVRDDASRPLHFIAQVQDLTARHSLEQRLREAHKLEAVGRLAGGVAHDFNNLLAAIAGYADLGLDGLPADSLVRQDLEAIRAAAARGARLTAQLLTFGRRHLRRPTAVDLGAVLQESAGLVRQLVGAHIEVLVDAAPGLFVRADPSEVDQILLNLVVNSRDAMPGGGTLHLIAEAVERAPGVPDESPPLVRLRVEDTGSGIEPSVLPHIFEPFFTTKGPFGNGLGLPTVYGIVTQNGGTIAVAGRPGRGTVFTVELPRDLEATASREVEASPFAALPGTGAAGKRGTVLLVEDESALRDVCRRVLERGGYNVIPARHGGDALRLWSENSGAVDLLLTDLVMPELGGRETAEAIRESRPDLPVIFMSGYTDDEIMRRALHEPEIAFLAKPFEPRALLSAVQSLLTR